jgi:hypothetical protein
MDSGSGDRSDSINDGYGFERPVTIAERGTRLPQQASVPDEPATRYRSQLQSEVVFMMVAFSLCCASRPIAAEPGMK